MSEASDFIQKRLPHLVGGKEAELAKVLTGASTRQSTNK